MILKIKEYLIAFLIAVSTSLGLYIKYLHTKNNELKDNIEEEKRKNKIKDKQNEINNRIKKHNNSQNEILLDSETEKQNDYAENIIKESMEKDITGNI